MKIRKQVYALTLDDLQETPAWEFALDEETEEGQDEATVRPLGAQLPVDPGGSMCVVRARFQLADGTQLTGYLYPPAGADSGLPAIQPSIVTPQGQVMFWFGAFPPKPNVLKEAYGKLGKQAAEVFPVSYESDVALVGASVKGSLNGFAHFRSLQDHTVVEIQ